MFIRRKLIKPLILGIIAFFFTSGISFATTEQNKNNNSKIYEDEMNAEVKKYTKMPI